MGLLPLSDYSRLSRLVKGRREKSEAPPPMISTISACETRHLSETAGSGCVRPTGNATAVPSRSQVSGGTQTADFLLHFAVAGRRIGGGGINVRADLIRRRQI